MTLAVNCLDAYYGASHILHQVSFDVERGQRVAIVGRNGAGKSTLLKSIINAGPRTTGKVEWHGQSLFGVATHLCAQRGLCLVPEDRRVLGDLTVIENLQLSYRSIAPDERMQTPEDMLRLFPMLANIGKRRAALLSGGQQQILVLARAVLSNPKLLLLDEPTEGLAPIIVENLADEVVGICERNSCGLLLCEQNIWFARRCTSHVYIIDTGRLVFSGGWEQLDECPEITERHLAV